MSNDYGMKVSEEGYGVFTADDKNLSLKTGFALLNVFDEGSGTGQATIAHNLGYEPQFLVWVSEDSGIKSGGTGLATGSDLFSTAFIDDSNLSIFTDPSSDYKYYIFYEPLDTGTAPSNTPTNNYGIKISKDGYDVNTANMLQTTFNSEKNSIKIAMEGADSNTVNTSYNFLISHGQSVNPGYMLYFEVDGSGKWWSENEIDLLSGKNVAVSSWTTSTQLVVHCESDSSCTVAIKYYILADPAE